MYSVLGIRSIHAEKIISDSRQPKNNTAESRSNNWRTAKNDPVDVSIHDPLSVVILIIDWVIMDDVAVNLVRLGDSGGSPAHSHVVSSDVTEF